MMFLEEIWSRNFTNLFIAPIKLSEMITSLTLTAILRALTGMVPAAIIAIPLFGVSVFKLGFPLLFLLALLPFRYNPWSLVTSGLLRFGPSFENIAWASLFFLAPLGCIYYPIRSYVLSLQFVAKGLPLVHIFEEMRNILLNDVVNYFDIFKAISISILYFVLGVIVLCFFLWSQNQRNINKYGRVNRLWIKKLMK